MKKQSIRIIPPGVAGLVAFFFCCVMISGAVAAEIHIIVHPSVEIDSISKAELERIFTGRKISWDNGQRIHPVLLDADDYLDSFVGMYLNRTPVQFENFWKRMMFTGRGMKPDTFGSDQQVIDFVGGTEGAIGFVASRDVSGNFKFIRVPE